MTVMKHVSITVHITFNIHLYYHYYYEEIRIWLRDIMK